MIRTHQLHRPTFASSGARYTWWLVAAVASCASETNDPMSNGDAGGSASTSGSASVSGSAGVTGQGGTAATGGTTAKAGAGGSSSTTAGTSSTGGSSSSAGSAGASTTGGTTTAGAGGTHAGGTSAGGSSGGGSMGGSSAGGGSAGGGAGGGAGTAGASSGGSGNTACDGGAVFCDDFEDGNATGWTKSGGTWAIVDDAGDGVYQGGNASEESYAGDTSWTDQTVQANVKVTSFGGTSDSYRAGIMARHNGSSNFYAFAIGGDGNLTLRKSTSVPSGSSGTCGAIASGIDATKWFTLKMSVSGGAGSVNIKTYLNGVLKHDCTTTSSTVAGGNAGVLTYGSSTVARFDDVSVTTP